MRHDRARSHLAGTTRTLRGIGAFSRGALRVFVLVTLLLWQHLALGLPAAEAATFTVNSANDVDDGNCNGAHCSLREAINAANASGGTDTITFNITGSPPYIITTSGNLPVVASGVVIDGSTQPGYTGTPVVRLNGGGGATLGLDLQGSANVVRGLSITNFTSMGILIEFGSGSTIENNYIGVDTGGSAAFPNGYGVRILGSANNVIGGDTSAKRNVISGNTSDAVLITAVASTGNTVRGNLIGITANSTAGLPNGGAGIRIQSGAAGNIVGGTVLGQQNTIINNTPGVLVTDSGTIGNAIRGNEITNNIGLAIDNASGGNGEPTPPVVTFAAAGTVTGTACANCTVDVYSDGVDESFRPRGSTIASAGGAWTFTGYITGPFVTAASTDGSGNTSELSAPYAVGFTVNSANDADDTVCNGTHCSLREAINAANAAGGTDIISFSIAGGGYQTISPTSALPAISDPVIMDARTQLAGGIPRAIELNGTSAGAGSDGLKITGGNSVIAGFAINRFGDDGIEVSLAGGNAFYANFIGTNTTALTDLGNLGNGIRIVSSPSNAIGGTVLFNEGNIISGNEGNGVLISGAASSGNIIRNAAIGTDVTFTFDLGNTLDGVLVSGAPNNMIGTPAIANLISGNNGAGVEISGAGASGNQVVGNNIGSNYPSGTLDIGNNGPGVLISGAPNNVVGLSSAQGSSNLLSGNGGDGVRITGAGATGNTARGNTIGLQLNGATPLANGNGIRFDTGAVGNTVGGFSPSDRNILSGNSGAGASIQSNDNTVRGNYIGTDITGLLAAGNGTGGVEVLAAGNGTIADNVISGNGGSGILMDGAAATGIDVFGNLIGVGSDGAAPIGNTLYGVNIANGASDNFIGYGPFSLQGNKIANNTLDGIKLQAVSTIRNRMRGNSIYANSGSGIQIDAGVQSGIAPPVITGLNNDLLTGTACVGCLIDVYSDDANEGRFYHGSVQADGSGNWTYAGAISGPDLTATQTDASGNTSAFSSFFVVNFGKVSGTGTAGFAGDGGVASLAQLDGPRGLFETPGGVLYLADTGNNRIRTITPNDPAGIINTIAGGGSGCGGQANAFGDGCAPLQGILASPIDVAVAPNGDVYIADTNHCRVRKISGGVITTFAGTTGSTVVCGYNGEGAAAGAQLFAPRGVAVDTATGDVYIADTENNRIRKVSAATGMISTVAGTGAAGFSGDGGVATAATLARPFDVVTGPTAWYIADRNNNRIRRVGFGANVISTIAGNGAAAFAGDGGFGASASLSGPEAAAVDGQGNLMIADSGNNRIRYVDAVNGRIDTIAGGGALPPPATGLQLQLTAPAGVASGTVTVSNTGEHQIVGAEGPINPQGGQPSGGGARAATSCAQNPGSVANADFLMLLGPIGAITMRKRVKRYLIALLSVLRPRALVS